MKRLLLALAVAAAFVLPATALAKGPSEASMTGPGLDKPLKFTGTEEPGSPLGDLTQEAGFFPAVFDQEPNPMLPARPKGDLGPKYTIDYTVPGPDNDTFRIVQDVYPYARPNAVTFTKPGQEIFDMKTRGGWYDSPVLIDMLVKAGLPAKPSAAATAPSSNSSFFSTGRLGVLVLVLLLLGAGTMVLRRRHWRHRAA